MPADPAEERYGDTDVVRRRAEALRESATDVREQAEELVARTDALAWRGRAATAMRRRVTDRADRLREAAGGFDTTADTLSRHALEVDRVREAIVERERRARALLAATQDRVARLIPGTAPDPDDATVLAALAEPPPAGHRAWLTLEVPGL